MMRKHISTIIVVGILLAAMVFAAGCTSNNNTPSPSVASATRDPKFVPKSTSGYLTYTNRSAGISIQYPESWQVKNGSGNEIVNFNVSGQPSMSYTVFTQDFADTSVTLSQFAQDALPTNLTNFKPVNSTNTTLSGYPAIRHIFAFANFDGSISTGTLYVTLANRTGYELLYVATTDTFNTYVGAASNMTASFNIVK